MPNAVKHSEVAKELKKEYLREHLETIKSLIRRWSGEIYAPEPLTPSNGIWGWQSLYCPPSESYPDDNHMLRRHLRSRALWSHHTDWQQKLENIWHLTQQLQEQAENKYKNISDHKKWEYTSEYIKTALWIAFGLARGKNLDDWYKIPDGQVGLSYGAYLIETSAASSEERSAIQVDHRRFIKFLSRQAKMKELVKLWIEASELNLHMAAIAIKALKSGDILYSCMFCKHLWT